MTIRTIFVGPRGTRAVWRLLIFLAIFLPVVVAANAIVSISIQKLNLPDGTPLAVLVTMAIFAAGLLGTTAFMARLEHRSLAVYGLPWRRAFCSQFWQGAAFSFVSITVLLAVLRLAGAYSFGSPALHGTAIVEYALLWTPPVFLAALVEDFFYRGYLLFTLADGLGFWPAAIVTSLLMGGAHYFNPGGHGVGPLAAFLYCIATSIVIRRTGDLWMALGIHCTWSWCEVFFFGIASSGYVSQGHLLNGTLHGPTWLTGGQFGPEASVPSLILLLIWLALFALWRKPPADGSLAARQT